VAAAAAACIPFLFDCQCSNTWRPLIWEYFTCQGWLVPLAKSCLLSGSCHIQQCRAPGALNVAPLYCATDWDAAGGGMCSVLRASAAELLQVG
jgi:hypothetical protein